MTQGYRITFVCTGNTCRSPMAEVIARKWLTDNDIEGISVQSAGILAATGHPASDGARWAVSEGGLDLDGHQATLLTTEVIASSDLILTMSDSHKAGVEDLGGVGRVHRLKDYAGEHGNVLDPFGGPDHVYQATFREIRTLVSLAMERLREEQPGR